MSRTFQQLYESYNTFLSQEYGLDWYDVQTVYSRMGNTPGIYPDAAMLLTEIVGREDVRRIVEIGSGVSTLYLAKAAAVFGKEFVSFEEDVHWMDMTRELLNHYRVGGDIWRYDAESITPLSEGSALFLDAQQALRETFFKVHPQTLGAGWILIDDCESAHHVVPNVASLAGVGRTNIFMFNPIGRKDRTVLVNPKDNAYSVAEWVWSWRPDKIFW